MTPAVPPSPTRPRSLLEGRLPAVLLGLAVLFALLHAWQLSGVLPERVASHFDAEGRANGWMPREAFLGTYLFVVALIGVVFLAVGFLERVPDSLINLPRKEFWLDPVRRASTFAWLRGWNHLFGALTVVLIVGIMRLAARVNLGLAVTLGDGAWVLLVLYAAAAGGMLVVMVVHFARGAKGQGAG